MRSQPAVPAGDSPRGTFDAASQDQVCIASRGKCEKSYSVSQDRAAVLTDRVHPESPFTVIFDIISSL